MARSASDDANNLILQRVEDVTFDGDTLPAVVRAGDSVAIPVRTICEVLGLDVERQSARLREHEVLSQGLRVVRMPLGGQLRSVMAISHKYVAFWLATVTPKHVKPALRPKLVRYQTELVDVLALLYGTNMQPTRPSDVPTDVIGTIQTQLAAALQDVRLLREALLSQQQETHVCLDTHDDQIEALEGLMDDLQQQLSSHTTITSAQQELLKRSIQRRAKRIEQRTGRAVYGKLFAQFCIDLGTPKYALLPAGKYGQALDWLRRKAAEELPDDPDALPPLQETLL
ncbi:MAG: phage antirepressor N-terminal domain-containing protein [Chloroflexota bacterium]|nr:phage antirepressor N-terminal domain-containing protein [Chloroflexota bacterium]